LARLFLVENHTLIGASRLQRWDVTKWGVTVNLALATASASVTESRGLLTIFCLCVAILGIGLIHYYNGRISVARENARSSLVFMQSAGVDLRAITGRDTDHTVPVTYDFLALVVFGGILGASVIPAFLVWIIG